MIAGALLSFALLFGAIVFAAALVVNKAVTTLVHERHQALDVIVNTGEVPPSWREPYDSKLAELAQEPGRAEEAATVRANATSRYLKRLDRLRRYVETTSLVDGEDVRQSVLDRLADVRAPLQDGPPR